MIRLDKMLLVKKKPNLKHSKAPKEEYYFNKKKKDIFIKNESMSQIPDDNKSSIEDTENKFVPFSALTTKNGLRKTSINIKLDIFEQKKRLLYMAFNK